VTIPIVAQAEYAMGLCRTTYGSTIRCGAELPIRSNIRYLEAEVLRH